jgi:2-polyprenyl-6-hydroxyphenyl methylase/3-demethylubiquinone-9 3-methyltransferase
MSTPLQHSNSDSAELNKFAQAAHRWWDLDGEFKPLHDINPLRVNWIASHARLEGAHALDIGCGGGILSEALAERGARVTGIDLAERALKVARMHALERSLGVNYELISAEQLAAERPGGFDVVCCMEMLEHVPRPDSVVRAAAQLVRPGGWVFFSTINRNLKSFALAIVGAEYLLRLLPRGTHEYARFLRPSELAGWAREAGLDAVEFRGLEPDVLRGGWRMGSRVDVNYFLACRRPGAAAAPGA